MKIENLPLYALVGTVLLTLFVPVATMIGINPGITFRLVIGTITLAFIAIALATATENNNRK